MIYVYLLRVQSLAIGVVGYADVFLFLKNLKWN